MDPPNALEKTSNSEEAMALGGIWFISKEDATAPFLALLPTLCLPEKLREAGLHHSHNLMLSTLKTRSCLHRESITRQARG